MADNSLLLDRVYHIIYQSQTTKQHSVKKMRKDCDRQFVMISELSIQVSSGCRSGPLFVHDEITYNRFLIQIMPWYYAADNDHGHECTTHINVLVENISFFNNVSVTKQ